MLLIIFVYFVYLSPIRTCPLNTVNTHSGCYCGIEIDGSNYIHCQAYTIDTIPVFIRSYVHEKLNLSTNFIRQLTDRSFQQLKVKRIYLEDNPLITIDRHAFDQNLLNYLEELHIESQSSIPVEFLCYGHWPKLRLLKLTGFNIEQYQHCFERLVRLEQLFIEKSVIDVLTASIYQLPLLVELASINNPISSLHFNVTTSSNRSSSIRRLNLTSNQLRSISPNLHEYMPQLTNLDLSHNHIDDLTWLSNATSWTINLTFNAIRSITDNIHRHVIDLSFNPLCTVDIRIDTIHILIRESTHLHCDCRLVDFLRVNHTNLSTSVGIHRPFTNETRCSTPQIFHGQYLKDLLYRQLLEQCSSDLPSHCAEVNSFQRIQIASEQYLHRNTTNTTGKHCSFSFILR
jgi:hypothetical protein